MPATNVRVTFYVTTTNTGSFYTTAYFVPLQGSPSPASVLSNTYAGESIITVVFTGFPDLDWVFVLAFDDTMATMLSITNIEFEDVAAPSPYGVIETTFEASGVSAFKELYGVIDATFQLTAFPIPIPTGLIECEVEAVMDATPLLPSVAKRIICTRYVLTVTDTDTSETMTFPISSLSVSSRSGNPSTISAVAPYSQEVVSFIAAVTHARIDVYRTQTDNTNATNSTLIEYGTLTAVRSDIGGRNASFTLTASSTKTNRIPKYVNLSGLSYVSVTDGKKRVRCTPSNDLVVGDTVNVGGNTLIANNIQLSVTPKLELMEIYE